MKIKTEKGVIKATKNIALLTGGLFVLTGTGIVSGNIINNSTINWHDVFTISTVTATTGAVLSAGYCYKRKLLNELYKQPYQKK